jgi:hypothetical protein
MITTEMLSAFFPDVELIENGINRFSEEVPAYTEWYFLKSYGAAERDVLIVSREENGVAAEFVKKLFARLFDAVGKDALSPVKLPISFRNAYGFQSVMLVGPEYHGYLKGTLDKQREQLNLGVPCFECEFSGKETKDEFLYMWIHLFPKGWSKRNKVPKISLSFENPKTRGGTKRDSFVLTRYNVLQCEIKALESVSSGYIRIRNFLDEECRVSSKRSNEYLLEVEGRKYRANSEEVLKSVDLFLVEGSSHITT